MNVRPMSIPDVLLISPEVQHDERGLFLEAHQQERYQELGIGPFAQDNVSRSEHGVLRGLHFQNPTPQGKLVTVLAGNVVDVAVDLRAGSPTFARHVRVVLGEFDQLWVPPGFAHGFYVLSEHSLVAYKCTAPYRPDHERGVRWDCPELGIRWPGRKFRLSPKDRAYPTLPELPLEHLFGADLS